MSVLHPPTMLLGSDTSNYLGETLLILAPISQCGGGGGGRGGGVCWTLILHHSETSTTLKMREL